MIRYLATVEIKENGEVRKIKHTFFKNFYLTDDELEKFLTFEFAKIYKAYTRHNYPVTKSYIGYFDATNGTVNINKIGYRDMGKTLKLVTNKTQALKLQVSKNNFDIKEQQKNIQKLKDIIANAGIKGAD